MQSCWASSRPRLATPAVAAGPTLRIIAATVLPGGTQTECVANVGKLWIVLAIIVGAV